MAVVTIGLCTVGTALVNRLYWYQYWFSPTPVAVKCAKAIYVAQAEDIREIIPPGKIETGVKRFELRLRVLRVMRGPFREGAAIDRVVQLLPESKMGGERSSITVLAENAVEMKLPVAQGRSYLFLHGIDHPAAVKEVVGAPESDSWVKAVTRLLDLRHDVRCVPYSPWTDPDFTPNSARYNKAAKEVPERVAKEWKAIDRGRWPYEERL